VLSASPQYLPYSVLVSRGQGFVGVLPVRWLSRQPERVPGKAQSRGIRQVVARVRQQREALGEPSADRLDDDKRDGSARRKLYRPARHVRGRVRLTMGVCVTGVVVRHSRALEYHPTARRQAAKKSPTVATTMTTKCDSTEEPDGA